tara:strand:+ start:364 stop:528 length:165 start_codon:yes stop_codon:yes gene_type:complete
MERVFGTISTSQTTVDTVNIGNWTIKKQGEDLTFSYKEKFQFVMKPDTHNLSGP